MEYQLFSSQNSDLNNDLALCIDNNPPLRCKINDATRATNKLHALQESYDCPIILFCQPYSLFYNLYGFIFQLFVQSLKKNWIEK